MQTDTGTLNKLIGNVSLKQGDSYMYCDSAYVDVTKNNFEAFSNVRIVQPGGTQVESDYLRYVGNTKKAYLRGNVTLTDGKSTLWAEELDYDLTSKIGVYTQGGTLQSETTTLSSNTGNYNVRSKDARFTGDVLVTDPEYNVVSEDLGYNTETKLVRFFGPSIVNNDKSELRTSSGTWDAKNEIAHFITRSSIQNAAQYIESDKMDYNRKTGFGVAVGNVIAIDTGQHTTLYCGYVQYNEITRHLLATDRPVMKQMNNQDSLFIRADTFYAAPVPKAKDTTKAPVSKTETKKLVGKNVTETIQVTTIDTLSSDSTGPRYFIGYHHVLVFSDSLQARCDSISYSQADSTMRLMYDPIAWSRTSQITGDTILLYMESSKLKKLYVPNNAFIVSQSGPPKALLFDQTQGKTLTAYFENNAIQQMIVQPAAEAIYYSKDDDGAYIGVNQAQSERMKVYFETEQVSRIVFEQEVKQTMTPMQQVNIPATKLGRFQWHAEKRPKSVQELFDYDPYPSKAKVEDTTAKPKAADSSKSTNTTRKKKR
jgi:lipopolysaccharide export system protein LptA